MIRVTMQFGGKPIRKYTFDKPLISIGREQGCDIVVENIGASRKHATIEKTEGGFVLTDLKSHNGTFVKGEKVFHHELTDSDEFFIGKYCFIFESLEPVVEVSDGADQPQPPGGMPDMTFRLDRKEIERIMGNSARGSAAQLVQTAPEAYKGSQMLENPYYLIGKHEAATIRLSGLFAPKKAAVIIRTEHGFRLLGLSRAKLNGSLVEDAPLQDGDQIQIGRAIFRFCLA